MRKGIDRLPGGRKKHDLLLWLTGLTSEYGGRFLVFDTECALSWGALSAVSDAAGKPMPVLDAMLAASALRYGCTLVTRNERDYKNAGVPLVTPWSSGQAVRYGIT